MRFIWKPDIIIILKLWTCETLVLTCEHFSKKNYQLGWKILDSSISGDWRWRDLLDMAWWYFCEHRSSVPVLITKIYVLRLIKSLALYRQWWHLRPSSTVPGEWVWSIIPEYISAKFEYLILMPNTRLTAALLEFWMVSWSYHVHQLALASEISWDKPSIFAWIKYMLKVECGTWYQHPRCQQCVMNRNLRIFKVTTWHYRCYYHLTNNCIWHDLLCCLLFCSQIQTSNLTTIHCQMRHQVVLETESKTECWWP